MVVNEEWRTLQVNKIPPVELHKLLNEKDFYILDVRPRDFIKNASFIEGSYFCPLVHLSKWYIKIPKDKPIIITDWAMRQSVIAAKFLIDNEYQIYGVLKGGIERWKEENLAVEERDIDIVHGQWYIPQE